MPGAASPSPSPLSSPGGRPHPRRCIAPIPGGARRPASSYLRKHDALRLLRLGAAWLRGSSVFSDPGFRRRLHPTPPVLGFLHNWEDDQIPRFIPATVSAFSLVAPDCRSWRALDCRHRRALFISKGQDAKQLLLLCDPITGSELLVPVPAAFESCEYGTQKMSPTAAVFCAKDGSY